MEFVLNSEITPKYIGEFCNIDDRSKEILKRSFSNIGLSARAYNKILKLARTIADLENEERILPQHIAEAVQYRSLDRKFWKR